MEDTKKLIEKYKRELMELSKTAPRTAREEKRTEEKPQKAPKIIGYVTEESGEFPSVFDKFITEAVENNEIETVGNEETGEMSEMIAMPQSSDNPQNTEEVNEAADDVIEVPEEFLDMENTGNVSDMDDTENASGMGNAGTTTRNTGNSENRVSAENTDVQDERAQGTGEPISNFPVPEYSNLAEFEAHNRGGGTLEFRVFAAREALPIENAAVVVTTRINGKDHEMFNTLTDNSGATETQTLPAPSKELSQRSENNIQPFSLYDATVEKKGYTKVILRNIPIFDGIQSIQRVAMLPEDSKTENDGNAAVEEITEVPNAK